MKIKIVNLNLWHGGRLWDSIISFLKKENPDIITLQEAHQTEENTPLKRLRTISLFKKILPLKHFVFSPELSCFEEGVKIDHGNAIFSRFTIKSPITNFFDLPYAYVDWKVAHKKWRFEHFPKNVQILKIPVNNSIINVLNMHGIWGTDGKDNERRLRMSKVIVDYVKNRKKVVLAGDFNLRPNTQTIRNIEKCLINVFKDELKTTFNIKRKNDPSFATAVVDMIFVSSDIKVVDHYCPQVDISDHLPLVAVLEI